MWFPFVNASCGPSVHDMVRQLLFGVLHDNLKHGT